MFSVSVLAGSPFPSVLQGYFAPGTFPINQ